MTGSLPFLIIKQSFPGSLTSLFEAAWQEAMAAEDLSEIDHQLTG